jgi:hypothetical protein
MAALSAVFKNSSAYLLISFCIINFTLDRTLIAILNRNSYMNVFVFRTPWRQKFDNVLLSFFGLICHWSRIVKRVMWLSVYLKTMKYKQT